MNYVSVPGVEDPVRYDQFVRLLFNAGLRFTEAEAIERKDKTGDNDGPASN